jgi:hypothetical protein
MKVIFKLTMTLIFASFVHFANSQCTNVLLNQSFENTTGVTVTNGNNIQPGTTWQNWTASAAGGINVIRVNGTAYASGPDTASQGTQYIDFASADGFVTQNFTLAAPSYIDFSGYFANRDAGTGGYQATASFITILNSLGNVVGTSNTIDLINAFGNEPWFYVSGRAGTLVPAGTYTYKAFIGNFAHFDNAFVCVSTAAVAGTIDCSKTQISPAPVAATPGQKTLTVTVNVTTAGCFAPISVTGSGMSLTRGFSGICTTTTGIQTFAIPVNYDGSALGTVTFTIGSAGTCSADLTRSPKKANCDIWTLECVSTAAPSLR